MDIDRFKQHHVDILKGIATLRRLAHGGVVDHAMDIARELGALSSLVQLHLAIEDRILYPSLQKGGDAQLAAMGKAYQEDMKGIAHAYISFSRKWGLAAALAKAPEDFRNEANSVLKALHARMQRENTEFYPAIERAE